MVTASVPCTLLIMWDKKIATVGAEMYRGVAGGPTSMGKDVVHVKHRGRESNSTH